MDSPRDGLEGLEVARRGRAIVAVIVLLAQFLGDDARDGGHDLAGVKVHDARVHVQARGVVQERGVLERGEDGGGELVLGREGVLIRTAEPTNRVGSQSRAR